MTKEAQNAEAETTRPLTVKELIDVLSTFPADIQVVVDGYEDGFDNIWPDSLEIVSMRPNVGKRYWAGENEDAYGNPREGDYPAVRIPRRHGDAYD